MSFLIYKQTSSGRNGKFHKKYLRHFKGEKSYAVLGTKTQAMKECVFDTYKDCEKMLTFLKQLYPNTKYYSQEI